MYFVYHFIVIFRLHCLTLGNFSFCVFVDGIDNHTLSRKMASSFGQEFLLFPTAFSCRWKAWDQSMWILTFSNVARKHVMFLTWSFALILPHTHPTRALEFIWSTLYEQNFCGTRKFLFYVSPVGWCNFLNKYFSCVSSGNVLLF